MLHGSVTCRAITSHVHTPCLSRKQHKASFNLHYQILVWLPSSSRVPQTPEQLSPDKPARDQQMCHINCKISHTNKRYTCTHTLNTTSEQCFCDLVLSQNRCVHLQTWNISPLGALKHTYNHATFLRKTPSYCGLLLHSSLLWIHECLQGWAHRKNCNPIVLKYLRAFVAVRTFHLTQSRHRARVFSEIKVMAFGQLPWK